MKTEVQSERDKFEAREKARIREREKFQEKIKEDVEDGKQRIL